MTYACTSAGTGASTNGLAPMKFQAIERPIEAPTPAEPTPMPTAAEKLATIAEIEDVLDASRSTLAAFVTLLPSMYAFVFVSTTFSATAPAPLTATPAPTPPAIATDAATVTASIVGRATWSGAADLRDDVDVVAADDLPRGAQLHRGDGREDALPARSRRSSACRG